LLLQEALQAFLYSKVLIDQSINKSFIYTRRAKEQCKSMQDTNKGYVIRQHKTIQKGYQQMPTVCQVDSYLTRKIKL
jgi:hypothetical protein